MEGIQVVSGQGQTGLRDKVCQASGGAPTELRPHDKAESTMERPGVVAPAQG